MPVYEKYTYTDGYYFCNVCDTPHEGAELAEECFDDCGGTALDSINAAQCGPLGELSPSSDEL